MKNSFLFYISLLSFVASSAQHCPWDCSGLIVLRTNISKEQMEKLEPLLVYENKNEIVDTIYGTGKETYDRGRLMYYDDFVKYRTERIKLHDWYRFDTVYHFAAGNYLVRYNYCGSDGAKLYVRFYNPNSRGLKYEYIEVPTESRIHLHEYSSKISSRQTEELKAAIQPKTVFVDCKKWLLRDCE